MLFYLAENSGVLLHKNQPTAWLWWSCTPLPNTDAFSASAQLVLLRLKNEVRSPGKVIMSLLASRSPQPHHHYPVLPPLHAAFCIDPVTLSCLLAECVWSVPDRLSAASQVSVTVTDASVQEQLCNDLTVQLLLRAIPLITSSQFHKDKRISSEMYMLGTGDVFVVILSCHERLRSHLFVETLRDTTNKTVTLIHIDIL